MTHRRDHYAMLGVPTTATQAQIRSAFRRLAREYHPDANREDPAAERQFKRLARAYEVLRDPRTRRAYDERFTWGRFAGPGGAGAASFRLDLGPIYHSDLGHLSDFYQAGDPLTVREAAALVGRNASWLRRAIRERRLPAQKGPNGYLLRRRYVEQLDRSVPRRRPRAPAETAPLDQGPPRQAATEDGAEA